MVVLVERIWDSDGGCGWASRGMVIQHKRRVSVIIGDHHTRSKEGIWTHQEQAEHDTLTRTFTLD